MLFVWVNGEGTWIDVQNEKVHHEQRSDVARMVVLERWLVLFE